MQVGRAAVVRMLDKPVHETDDAGGIFGGAR
jgi:hypothetical protein